MRVLHFSPGRCWPGQHRCLCPCWSLRSLDSVPWRGPRDAGWFLPVEEAALSVSADGPITSHLGQAALGEGAAGSGIYPSFERGYWPGWKWPCGQCFLFSMFSTLEIIHPVLEIIHLVSSQLCSSPSLPTSPLSHKCRMALELLSAHCDLTFHLHSAQPCSEIFHGYLSPRLMLLKLWCASDVPVAHKGSVLPGSHRSSSNQIIRGGAQGPESLTYYTRFFTCITLKIYCSKIHIT